jgi:CubicO group peptidase (beta-lactamase class C family)
MLGIVLERASGERFADLCSRLLWQPLAASADAFITVDNLGAPRTAGGMSVRPHDLLALGEMLLSGGVGKHGRIISERWIKDMRTNGDADAWRRGTQADFLAHGRYRSNWYQIGGGSNAFLAAGIHGQFLYCDPDTGTVIACTSSQHEPQDGHSTRKCWPCLPPSARRHDRHLAPVRVAQPDLVYSNTISGIARLPSSSSSRARTLSAISR